MGDRSLAKISVNLSVSSAGAFWWCLFMFLASAWWGLLSFYGKVLFSFFDGSRGEICYDYMLAFGHPRPKLINTENFICKNLLRKNFVRENFPHQNILNKYQKTL